MSTTIILGEKPFTVKFKAASRALVSKTLNSDILQAIANGRSEEVIVTLLLAGSTSRVKMSPGKMYDLLDVHYEKTGKDGLQILSDLLLAYAASMPGKQGKLFKDQIIEIVEQAQAAADQLDEVESPLDSD